MNFIKKKLKSHKKEDEEEEYEKAVYEASLKTGDQNVKNTEEWQFFQQLSMKVQDTVQKTQTTLNKLKDIRQDSKEDFDFAGETTPDFNLDDNSPFGTGKVVRAPPRPPPPSGDKPWFPVEESEPDFSAFSAKGPARPPPPPSRKETTQMPLVSDNSALHAKPPLLLDSQDLGANGMQFNQMPLSMSQGGTQQGGKSFSLLEEFGFQTDTAVTSYKSDFQDLLFLDVKEETDPFDTSFVDVTNIAQQTTPIVNASKISETSCNPFSNKPNFLMEGLTDSKHENESNIKKTPTNPFFSGSQPEAGVDATQTSMLWSHNPFSDSKPATSSSTGNEDLFSIEIHPSDQKTILDDTSGKSEMSLMDSLSDDLQSFHQPPVSDTPLKFDMIDIEPTHVSEASSNPAVQLLDQVSEAPQVWQNLDSSENSHPQVLPEILNQKPRSGSQSSEASASWDCNPVNRKSSVISNISNEICIPQSADIISNQNFISSDDDQNVGSKDAHIDLFDTKLPDNTNAEVVDELEDSVKNSNSHDDEFKEESVKETEFISVVDSNSHQMDSVESVPELKNEEQVLEDVAAVDSSKSEQIYPDSTSALPLENEQVLPDTAEAFSSTFPDVTDAASLFGNIKTTLVPTQASNDIKPSTKFTESFIDDHQSFGFSFKTSTTTDQPDQEFDAFSAKFESARGNASDETYDPFSAGKAPMLKKIQDEGLGFGSMDEFDPFKVSKMQARKEVFLKKEVSQDSFDDYDNETDFSVVIKPKVKDLSSTDHLVAEPPKLLPPPPKTPTKAFDSSLPRFNPFDKDSIDNTEKVTHEFDKAESVEVEEEPIPALGEAGVRKADSIETPLSPLFDEDTSLPLEEFPKRFPNESWEMVLRQPNKKKLTGNRFWKKIIVKLSENSVLQLFNKKDDKLPFQELPLQACYSLSEVGAQQYDQYGKIFTVKLQYKFYRERVGVRPGQISKVTQGQVTTMGDVARLGLPLQHSPQTSQLLKLGTHLYSEITYFIQEVENALFRMVVHRDRVLTYKTEEIQVIAQDEFYVEQSKTGHVDKQLARVRVFFLAFITGMPSVEVGLNDINRQGKEVVGRYDIIPVVTEEWIRLEDWEFHACVIQEEFQKTRIIKFHPPDACLFELLRFRIRPPRNRELPLQVRVFMTVTSTRVEIRSDILVPGYSSRKQGQIPCENIQIRFPIPECWIYLFRTEKHFRYGSKKSAARRPGKIKGLERIIGAAQNLDPSLIEVSAGQAKYEHVFHAVVWRIPRLPKEGQGAYTQQLFLLRTELTSFDQIPESFEQYVDVEFTMPATYVSHTTVRSVSVSNPTPPEKYVRYISKHEYRVEIDFKSADEIDGLMASSNVNAPVTTATVQENTEDEKDEDEDSD